MLLFLVSTANAWTPNAPQDFTQFKQLWSTGTTEARDVAISPNGTWVAAGTASDGGKEVKILNMADGKILFTLPYQTGSNRDAYTITFSPNGTYLAVGGTNNNITVWDTQTRKSVPGSGNIGTQSAPYGIEFSPNGKYMLAVGLRTGGGGAHSWVRGWDATAGFTPVNSFSHDYSDRDAYTLAINPAGTRYAVGLESAQGTDVYVYALPSGVEVANFNILNSARSLAFSHDGQYLAMGRAGDQRYGFNDADVLVWDMKNNYSGQGNPPIRSRYDGFPNNMWVRGVAWSMNDAQIIAGGDQNNLHIFDPANGNQIGVLNSDWIWSLTVSKNDIRMVTAHGGAVKAWGDTSAPKVAGVELWTPERGNLPFIPNFVKGEKVLFNVTFNKMMDTKAIPIATFGKTTPYKQFALNAVGWLDTLTWQGEYNFTGSTVPEGTLTLLLTNASDTNGNKIQPDSNFTFFLDMKVPTLSYTQPGYWQRADSALVPFTATDPDPTNSSELALMMSFARFNNDLNASWSSYDMNSAIPLSGTSVSKDFQFNFTSGEGYYEGALAVFDRSMNGRLPTANDVYLGYDNTTPTITIDPISPYWSKNTTFNVTYTVEDNVNLTILYTNVSWSPDNSTWTYGEYSHPISGKTATYVWKIPQASGYYVFGGACVDESGLACSMPTGASTGIDSYKPQSNVHPLKKYTNNLVFNLPFDASDNLSGISRTELYSNDGSGWAKSSEVNYDQKEFSFTAPQEGTYQFYSIAYDNASNAEDAPAANDTWTIVDVTPPTLTLINPSPSATNVPITTDVKVKAGQDTDKPRTKFTLSSASGSVSGDLAWEGDVMKFTPISSLTLDTKYDIAVTAEDLAGNVATSKWSFTTQKEIDVTPPKVVSTSPAKNEIVASVSHVKIVFDEPMLLPDIESSASISPGTITKATWYASNRTLDLAVKDMVMDQNHVVTISSEKAKDLSGNALDGDGDGNAGGNYVFSFYVTNQQPAKLTVTVLDRANYPIMGANVSLLFNGNEVRRLQTNPQGMVEFTGLMPGKYTIRAEREGYNAATGEQSLAFGDSKSVTFTLVRPGEIAAEEASRLAWLLGLLLMVIVIVVTVFLFLILRRRGKKECPECGDLIPAKSNLCHHCGYDFIRKTKLTLGKDEEKLGFKKGKRPKPAKKMAGPPKPEEKIQPSEPERPQAPQPAAAPLPVEETKKDIEKSEEEKAQPIEEKRTEEDPPAKQEAPARPEAKDEESETKKRALEKIRKRREQRGDKQN
jgi:WD40 repeat protein